jgi:mono/diheme cytochrome c family protein
VRAQAGVSLQDGLIEALQGAESGLVRALHAVGLAPDAHGQAAWPFSHRIATETLAIDAGLTRQLAWAMGAAGLALALVAAGALFRRVRWPAWAGAGALMLLAQWPTASPMLADATPTSFHRSPTGFRSATLERGLAIYQSRCAACHGTDGRGEGPRAASLPMWPPRLDGALLWRRAEGEVFWHILHGLHDSAGAVTMPGFDGQLSDADVWSLIDGM